MLDRFMISMCAEMAELRTVPAGRTRGRRRSHTLHLLLLRRRQQQRRRRTRLAPLLPGLRQRCSLKLELQNIIRLLAELEDVRLELARAYQQLEEERMHRMGRLISNVRGQEPPSVQGSRYMCAL